MQNFFIDALPINNIYYEAERILKSDKSIQKVIISANPFSSFFIGYKLKKKFPYIKWVADYRDDWNTSELKHSDNILNRFISLLESISEKKWVGSASYITTISGYYLSKILGFVSNKGAVILNGFFEEDLNNVMPVEKAGTWVITYNGTLYPTQNIEMFLDAFKILADRYKGVIELKINFPGLAYNRQQADRVMNAMHGYQHLLNITERVPRQKVFELQNASHAFLMVSHTGVKGIPSSKLYEYLCFAKPVILCPNDQDIIEETLNDTGLGIICSNTNDIVVKLSELIDVYIATGKISIKANNDRIYRYSRRSQTKALADVLDQL
jgi:glycosyltransferase involved in cell wall biosynthesis